MTIRPVGADRLRLRTDPARLPFDTTAGLGNADGAVGQDRAMRALEFGARMARPGYNIFVTGPQGSGKRAAVRQMLERMAATMPVPSDWVYVHNFATPYRPLAIRFPPGQGLVFKQAMNRFLDSLKSAMPRLFASEDYRRRRNAIENEFHTLAETRFDGLRRTAETHGLALVERKDGSFDFQPQREGVLLTEDEQRRLSRHEREKLSSHSRDLRGELDRSMDSLGSLREDAVERMRNLDRELGEVQLRALIDPLSDSYRNHREVFAWLEALLRDALAQIDNLQAIARGDLDPKPRRDEAVPYRRYEVNLLVDHSRSTGGPVVQCGLPSLSHLIGKVEHVPMLVATVTDFMFIRRGALHEANGGFLLIDAMDLLQQEASWGALKRALKSGQLRIENLAELLDRNQNVTIQPEAIPLDCKIVLFGDPWIYHRLRQLDPEFADLFKVQADFSTTVDRDDENCESLIRLMAQVSRNEGLRHLDRTGAARLMDEAARMAGDAEKISVRTGHMSDLLREADHFASLAGRALITSADVDEAIAAQQDRSGRIKAFEHELIKRNILFIDTDGKKVGQVNGLTVMSAAGFAFGMPTRITARAQAGDGRIVSIERLANFSGPTHTKGVQTFSGYLNGHYAAGRALSLSASVAFEQSYGAIDGDSASAAELIAILSSIAEVPLKQTIAMTGSIDQHGAIQPVGGINEKIEGFFDICASRGFAKGNGVIIPKANLVNLMLREDAVEAAIAGKFAVYAVETVDEAIEILTGMKAGSRRRNGSFPRGSFNRRVFEKLTWFARPRVLRPVRLEGFFRL